MVLLFNYQILLLFLHFFDVGKCQAFSSCAYFSQQNWIKGSGSPIKSWLQSIVSSTGKNSSTGVSVHVDKNIKKIWQNETLRWAQFGPNQNDGWLYKSRPHGHFFTGTEITYVYDDFHTVLHGQFINGRLKNATASKIIAYRCSQGIMEIKLSKKSSLDSFSYSPITEKVPERPTLMDPLVKNQIYIAESALPNMSFSEGVFAKKGIARNQLITPYAGMLFNASKEAYTANMTIEEKEDIHKNWLHYDDNWMIDVPPALTSIVKYRSALGHKVNHKFHDFNSEFVYLKHPIFGNIRGIAAVRNIEKNEEVFVDYQYDLGYEDTPAWYRDGYKKIHGK